MQDNKSRIAIVILVTVIFNVGNAVALQTNMQSTEYVGSTNCIQCHRDKYDDWLKSDHRKAMQSANQNTVLGNFEDITVTFHGINEGHIPVAEPDFTTLLEHLNANRDRIWTAPLIQVAEYLQAWRDAQS